MPYTRGTPVQSVRRKEWSTQSFVFSFVATYSFLFGMDLGKRTHVETSHAEGMGFVWAKFRVANLRKVKAIYMYLLSFFYLYL
jgi:hypothetical protein